MDRWALQRAGDVGPTPPRVEEAGDVDTLLLDKTGTITLRNRQATEASSRCAAWRAERLADAAQLASLAMRRQRAVNRGAGQGEDGIRGRDLAHPNARQLKIRQRRSSG